MGGDDHAFYSEINAVRSLQVVSGTPAPETPSSSPDLPLFTALLLVQLYKRCSHHPLAGNKLFETINASRLIERGSHTDLVLTESPFWPTLKRTFSRQVAPASAMIDAIGRVNGTPIDGNSIALASGARKSGTDRPWAVGS